MASVALLYNLLGVSPDCTDDELRRAYYHAMLEHHPDKNPDRVEAATAKAQQLTAAYAELKRHRSMDLIQPEQVDSAHKVTVTVGDAEWTIHLSFSFGGVDIQDIAARKAEFRKAWQGFRQDPTDPIAALRLIHVAFRAERQDAVQDLLLNPVLIDAASLLLSFVEVNDAYETLVKWTQFLQQSQKAQAAVQILEDAFEAGDSPSSVAEELRHLHYAWAQYEDPTTGEKATPQVRIEHLNRILEIGFKYDYIYKFLAEAYHDLGDNEQARIYLKEAYRINPQLSGAVRISRALGLAQQDKTSKKKTRAKYKYSRPEQIPSPSQIRTWAQQQDWSSILAYANPSEYSPRILPRSRETLRQIAASLGSWPSDWSRQVLTELLHFTYYWDVSEAAMTSLSKIGDGHTIKLLEQFTPTNSRGQANREACLSYLRARVRTRLPSAKTSTETLVAQAERAFEKQDFGRARLLLENHLASVQPSQPLYNKAVILLARSCAKMNDFRTSIELLKSILPTLSNRARHEIAVEMLSWLWSDLVFSEYDSGNDDDYVLALDTQLDLALTSETPDGVLGSLRYLTRWLELLGMDETTQWIRQLIRTEAPGTWYVDKHDRENYVRDMPLSEEMRAYLAAFDNRVKSDVAPRLREVLKSQTPLRDPDLYLPGQT